MSKEGWRSFWKGFSDPFGRRARKRLFKQQHDAVGEYLEGEISYAEYLRRIQEMKRK